MSTVCVGGPAPEEVEGAGRQSQEAYSSGRSPNLWAAESPRDGAQVSATGGLREVGVQEADEVIVMQGVLGPDLGHVWGDRVSPCSLRRTMTASLIRMQGT